MSSAWREKASRESVLRRIGDIAARQWGVVGTPQLLALGLDYKAISRLTARGFLVRLHPGVYAVGYRSGAVEARLQTALLLGGEQAALSHRAGAFWLGLSHDEPRVVEARVPTRRRHRRGVRFHTSPDLKTVRVRGFSVTSPALTLVDYAARVSPQALRSAVAAADRMGLLDPVAIDDQMRRGRRGSAALRLALDGHLPQFTHTLSELEDRFLELVRRAALPLPEVNVTVGGMMVDALFAPERLVVELDGHRFHANPVASEEDRHRELRLRALGYRVIRYTWKQVTRTPTAVIADLRRELAAAPRLGSGELRHTSSPER